MPSLDLGPVVGPQGEQGATGAQGIRGEQGLPGPNQVTNSTATPLTGVLTGNGSVVGVANIDAAPTPDSTGFAQSGGTDKAIKARVPVYGLGKNLLRNWYFGNPVNQRGQTSYTGGTYSIDAWNRSIIAGSEVTVASGYVTFGPANASNNASMQQKLEADTTNRLQAGCTVTASLLLNDGTLCYGSLTLSAGTSAYNVFVTTINGTEFRVSVGGNRDNFNIVRTGSKVNMVAVKLELGSEQTLCHNEGTAEAPVWVLNEVPDYEYELYRCITSTADSSDTYANKTLATAQEIAPAEDGDTASQGYAIGKYFCRHGLTYRAKTAISAGDSFTVGTNCEVTNGGGLNDINTTRTENVTFSTNITGYTYGSVPHLSKSGNIVLCDIVMSAGAPIAGSNTLLCTVPVGFRPIADRRIPVWLTYGGEGKVEVVALGTDGEVKTASGSNTVTGFIRIFGSYTLF